MLKNTALLASGAAEIKRFKSFWSSQKLISGIETIHLFKKGQLHCHAGQPMSAADQFYSLAF